MNREAGMGAAVDGHDPLTRKRAWLVRVGAAVLALGILGAARPPLRAVQEDQGIVGFTDGQVPAARHLLARATFGARESDLARVLAMGRDAWIEEQLFPALVPDVLLQRRLTDFPAAAMSQDALYKRYPPPRILTRLLQRRAKDSTMSEPSPSIRARGLHPPARILFDLVSAKLQRAVYSERQLEAVMMDFWFNHFNVFFAKGADRWLVGEYERESIRPHVFGSFEDLLLATARHPAMLFYLDNWQNVGPDSMRPEDRPGAGLSRLSPSVRRRALARRGLDADQVEQLERAMAKDAKRGINENYARELLELHTLGVDGGYTQDDVMELARVFTGWTVAREGAAGPMAGLRARGTQSSPIEFRFRPELHDLGQKIVLGHSIKGQGGAKGVAEGEEVLRLLARHPATARHIASKLAVAFVADEPAQALVAELERVFLETGGNLRAVTRALFTSDAFYDESIYDSKIKSPFELVASALRVTNAAVGPSRALVQRLEEMGELPYMSQEPTGYGDQSEDWMSSASVLQRVNFALALAGGRVGGIHTPRPTFPPKTGTEGRIELLLETLLPGAEAGALAATIAAEIKDDSEEDELARALGLALGSPQFQRR